MNWMRKFRKVGQEPLQADIDAKLHASEAVANLVRDLPEDTVSMVWRSSLNAKLAQSRVRARRRRLTLVISPVVGLGLACSLAGLWMARPVDTKVSPASVEAGLIAAHQQADDEADMAGFGFDATDLVEETEAKPTSGKKM
jgi:hypothetical protein